MRLPVDSSRCMRSCSALVLGILSLAIATRTASADDCGPKCVAMLYADAISITPPQFRIDPVVPFEAGRTALGARAREAIAEVARSWWAHPSWGVISVVATADRTRPGPAGIALARERSATVRDALLAEGLPADYVVAADHVQAKAARSLGRLARRAEFVVATCDRDDACPDKPALAIALPARPAPEPVALCSRFHLACSARDAFNLVNLAKLDR